MNNIEVEIRSFLTKEKYQELLDFFNSNGELMKEDYQETFYFDCSQDLRIQKNDQFSKIWLKKGALHDEHREEIEIKFEREQFDELEKLFLNLGYQVEIKWYRKRYKFKWREINVCMDYTKGYGYILELEKMSNEDNKQKDLSILKELMEELRVELTPKEVFEQKFANYQKNWRNLIEVA